MLPDEYFGEEKMSVASHLGDGIIYSSSLANPQTAPPSPLDKVLFRCETPAWSEHVPTRIASATIHHRAWTDARRRNSLRTVFRRFFILSIYCPFRTENWLYSVERIEAGENG
jgi:hypothetical protein